MIAIYQQMLTTLSLSLLSYCCVTMLDDIRVWEDQLINQYAATTTTTTTTTTSDNDDGDSGHEPPLPPRRRSCMEMEVAFHRLQTEFWGKIQTAW